MHDGRKCFTVSLVIFLLLLIGTDDLAIVRFLFCKLFYDMNSINQFIYCHYDYNFGRMLYEYLFEMALTIIKINNLTIFQRNLPFKTETTF